jgi:endonuclease-3
MNQEILQIIEQLEYYFPNPEIPLDHSDPYTLLIATLLSQRCTDKRVNEITPLLFAQANTPEQMIKLPVQKLEKIIAPIGLFHQKARNIQLLSQILIDKFQGQVPSTFEELTSLPGVGIKTAQVVLVQAFNQEAFPVDTHIFRLAKRWRLSSKKTIIAVEKDLKALFPSHLWGKLHLQMILFGRTYCKALAHHPERCPICSLL